MRGRKLLTAVTVLVGVLAGGAATAGSANAASLGTGVRADTFRLINAATDQCADRSTRSTTGREVVQEPCTGGFSQIWLAQPVPAQPLTVQIINRATGLCMDLLVGGESAAGTPVVQAHCSIKLASQQWQFVTSGGVPGLFRVVNQALGQCLEVQDGSPAQGAPIQVSTCVESAAHQVWHKLATIGS
jgi:hypothetical protein